MPSRCLALVCLTHGWMLLCPMNAAPAHDFYDVGTARIDGLVSGVRISF